MKSILVASNRLPVTIKRKGPKGPWHAAQSAGGLVTAMLPVLKQRGGTWLGWSGTDDPRIPVDALLEELSAEVSCTFRSVPLTSELVEEYYYGFANETIWPLFHDLIGHVIFESGHWPAYVEANNLFAESIAPFAGAGRTLWVHDYQLMLTGRHLRHLGITDPILFFLHIPFPSPDMFMRLPWRQEILEGLLDYDQIGLQTHRDFSNFLHCVRAMEMGDVAEVSDRVATVRLGTRRVRVGSWPIGIDFEEFDREARSWGALEEARALRSKVPSTRLVCGVDRLDYTKGIVRKFRAFEKALRKHPDLIGRVSLLQVVVPSRDTIPAYQALRTRIEQEVGRINGLLGEINWVPIHYMYRSVSRKQLLAIYMTADAALVTPMKDGMNLVAKEYCAACGEWPGVLILSEFAGAAEQLRDHGAILVNPYDIDSVADAIHGALSLPAEDVVRRTTELRRVVREHDVKGWASSFLEPWE